MSPGGVIAAGSHAAGHVQSNYILNLVPVVILYYDFVLTSSSEIRFFWPPHNKQGWGTFAFLLNRYLSFFGYIPMLISFFGRGHSPKLCVSRICQGLHAYHEVFEVVLQIAVGVLCAMRVHALYGRSRRALSLLVLLATASVVVGGWAILADRYNTVKSGPVVSDFPGCNRYTTAAGGRQTALAWSGVLVFDSAVFLLTLRKACAIGRGAHILDVIVRDGTVYFSALFVVNLANILTLRFAPTFLRASTTTLTNVFVQLATSVEADADA
ncbi:hypothetical protein BC834DRAFT_973553 [Gloeopeniophorella convolvens]|nr:hypothetical protein BC834DRAFT_973553 [Gloeopeniophorella convolvens]